MLRKWIEEGKAEIALHGFTHRSNPYVSVPSRSELSEFRGLTETEQISRLRAGITILESTLGVRPDVFIPPWNEWDSTTLRACLDAGIEVISADRFVPVPLGMTAINQNCSLETFVDSLAVAREAQQAVLIVVLYHSKYIRSPDEFALLERVVASAAEAPDVNIVTLGELARDFADLAKLCNLAGREVSRQDRDPNTNRGAAFLHRRLARMMHIPLQVEALYQAAHVAYARGDYKQAASMSSAIDSECAKVVMVARCTFAVVGAGYGALLLLTLRRVTGSRRTRAMACVGALVMTGLVGSGIGFWAIAPVTRAEILIGTALLVGGASLGSTLWAGTVRFVERHRRGSAFKAA